MREPLSAADPDPGEDVVTEVLLSRNQVAVADAVTRSHLTTPTAFIVVKVDMGGASAYARAATWRLRTLVGLPEIAVKVLASLYPAFPAFFAGPAAKGRRTRLSRA
jgi:hypothetical protein